MKWSGMNHLAGDKEYIGEKEVMLYCRQFVKESDVMRKQPVIVLVGPTAVGKQS